MGSRLTQKTREEQVSVFLYTMGDRADDIMKTMNIDEDTIEFDTLIAKFDNYYGARKTRSWQELNSTSERKDRKNQWKPSSKIYTNYQRIVNMDL